jgi:serine/threonine protein kinase
MPLKHITPKPGMIIADKYQLVKKIGAGSFGFVFSAKARDSNSPPIYAVKFERCDVDQKVLHIELDALNYMQGYCFWLIRLYM